MKDLKEYELTLLMTTEEKNSPQDDRIRSIFLIKNKEEDGWKTLAYPITEDGKTYEKGYFVYYDIGELLCEPTVASRFPRSNN